MSQSGPGIDYTIVTRLSIGAQVRVLTSPIEIRGQQWQRVRTEGGQVGWCRVDELMSVDAGE